MNQHTRAFTLIVCLATTLLLGCQPRYRPVDTTPETVRHAPRPEAVVAAEAASTDAPESNVVEARGSIRSFSPEETTVDVDAAQVSLRQILEDLGPDAALWYQHVLTLSNPYFEGRAPGTEGIARAADYVEYYFRQYGLEPAFFEAELVPGGSASVATSYRQPFDFPSPSPAVEVHEAQLAINGEPLVADEDFTVLGNSASHDVTAQVVFVGYGIEEGQDGYSSFGPDERLDGRIALLLRYEPLDEEGTSRWSERRFSRHASIASKMRAVAERGAAGVLLVTPPGAVDGRDGLESPQATARWGRRLGVPSMQITLATAERLLAAGDPEGRDLTTWRTRADTGEITTVDLDPALLVTMSTDLDVQARLDTENVGGILRGRGDLADEWVIIGGHYDHVGFGYTGTMPSNIGKLHPGADDNASGTAGVLMAAKRIAGAYEEMADDESARSIAFVAFSAEEAGLHGSRHYVESMSLEPEDVTLMFNMDMIGRLRSETLRVQGTGTAEEFDELLTPHFESSGLKIVKSPGGRGPSDHANFYTAGIPVLFAFTGTHENYHQPTDFGYTVNPAGAMEVLDLVEAIVLDVATQPQRLTYSVNDQGGGGRRGSRVRLGIMPSYTAELDTGVLVESVSDGTSAAVGGMEGGDIIVSWNGEAVDGGRRLFELLAEHEPGDVVQVGVMRGESEQILSITLQAREQDG